ncbi:MAG TPA: DUF3943 domain-containing protein [Variovorax sp.]|nr:DUF3943 domain-containing protein [Variovorax sp.]
MPRSRFVLAVVALVLALAPWLAAPVLGAHPEQGSAAPAQPPLITPDWQGLKRDTWYFVGYQAVAVAVLHALPEEETNFDRSNVDFGKWKENVSNPVWDDDDAFVNYVLHPYWGAAYYIRGRERGLSRWQSLGYSTLLSVIYEFGAEAMFEPVSYQDLVVTPLAGWLIGEYVFSPIRDSIKAKEGELDFLDKTVLVLTDPLGALNGLTDKLFGVETQVALAPIVPTTPGRNAWAGPGQPNPPRRVAWGLRLQVRW